MAKPEVRRVGDSWLYMWPEHRVAIGLEQLRERSDGLHAEITIRGMEEGEPAGHIHWSGTNLSSLITRQTLIKALNARDDTTPWHELVEIASVSTARDFRNGLETVNLATIVVPDTRPYLVSRVLPAEELSMIYGDGTAGKSLIALSLGIACGTGHALPSGLKPLKRCPVWYLDYETNARTHARRLGRLAEGLCVQKPDVAYTRMPRPVALAGDALRKEVRACGYGLVIVDSAGYAADGNINEPEVATRLCNTLVSLETTVILVHHLNKEAAAYSRGPVKPYGSAYFYNSARNAWEIRSTHPKPGILDTSWWHRKDNDDELQHRPIGLEFTFVSAQAISISSLDVGQNQELAEHGGLAFQLRTLLAKGPWTVQMLAAEVDATSSQVYKALRRMPDAFELEPGTRGRGNAGTWGLMYDDGS